MPSRTGDLKPALPDSIEGMGKDVMAAGNICTVRANVPEEWLRFFLL